MLLEASICFLSTFQIRKKTRHPLWSKVLWLAGTESISSSVMNCSGCEARFPKSVISLLSMIVSVLSDPPFTQWTTILLTPHTISTHTSFPFCISVMCHIFRTQKLLFIKKVFLCTKVQIIGLEIPVVCVINQTDKIKGDS